MIVREVESKENWIQSDLEINVARNDRARHFKLVMGCKGGSTIELLGKFSQQTNEESYFVK